MVLKGNETFPLRSWSLDNLKFFDEDGFNGFELLHDYTRTGQWYIKISWRQRLLREEWCHSRRRTRTSYLNNICQEQEIMLMQKIWQQFSVEALILCQQYKIQKAVLKTVWLLSNLSFLNRQKSNSKIFS